MTAERPFFILTCARSGSTSLCRILATASNGTCALEPSPNLNVETRLAMEGRLRDPRSTLERLLGSRIREGIREHGVYGEKNLTYGPFVALLYELFDAKFVFIRRDGRDVVRSLLDWHDRMFGSIYRECRDPGNLTPRALEAAAGLLVHEDSSDFSRPRPLEGAPWYDEWDEFSRFEMCAYYWDAVNRLYADRLELLPKDAWIDIDYTSVEADDVMRVASFCGLEGLDDGVVETMLTKRINSLAERVGDLEAFPGWENWDPHLTERYWRIAGETMRRFGYRDPR